MPPYRRVFWLTALACLLLSSVRPARADPPAQVSSAIHYGEIVRSQLGDAIADETWAFAGRAGDVIMIDMQTTATTDLDPYLTLLDAQGDSLLTDDDGGEGLNARIGPYTLPDGGQYSIVASRYSGTGAYTLALVNLKTVPAIQIGKPLVGVVDASHPSDFFLVAPPDAPGALLRVRATDDDSYSDPYLSLYGPNGFITSTEYLSEGTLDPISVEPDKMVVIAVSWNSASGGSAYQLVVEPSQIELLADGVSQTATLTYDVSYRQHYFRGEAGQSVRVTVTSDQPGFIPWLRITTTDTMDILFSSEGSAATTIAAEVVLPRSDVYLVEVSNPSLQSESSAYTVRLDVVGN